MELMAETVLNEAGHDMSESLTGPEFARNKAHLAITKPYLMHEVLAFSGLYLFAKDTLRRGLMTRALFHQPGVCDWYSSIQLPPPKDTVWLY